MLLQSMEETHPGGFTQKSLLDQAWMSQPIVRSHHGVPNAEFRRFYLPQDRARADMIINCYFEELDWHRPVFIRQDFHESVQALYDSVEGNPINPRYSNIQDDPGFICSLYLALALGTLCIDNMKLHRLIVDEAPTWPTPDEFFTQALAIKPDLRVTISSLQALILLHWYLYTEVRCCDRLRTMICDAHIYARSVMVALSGVTSVVWFAWLLSLVCIMTRQNKQTRSHLRNAS
jgi:hypothetical protein